MAIGDNARFGYNSAIGVAKETTFGTHVTATAYFCFNSEGLVKTIDEIRLESICNSRNYKKRMQGNERAGGPVEAYLDVSTDAIVNLIKQALGGSVTSSTLSAGVAFAHTIAEGDMENNASSGSSDMKGLSLNVQKGGILWDFDGSRVNQMTVRGNIGEPVMISFDLLSKSATLSSDSLTISYSNVLPVNFSGVTIKNADNIGSIGSGTTETFESFELTLNNNIDGDRGKLGSRLVSILPPVRRDIKLRLGQRFDTTTAYTRFNSASSLAVQILLDSAQSLSSSSTYSMHINLGRVYFNSNMPSVGDPGVLMYDMDCSAVEDSTASYAIQVQINNATASYV